VPDSAAARVRAPAEPCSETCPAVADAARATVAGRPEVLAAYVFEQPDLTGRPRLYVGMHLTRGVVAAVVMPALDADLRRRLPAGERVAVIALSRRMLLEVRQRVAPVADA
jgi:hypothetical protein